MAQCGWRRRLTWGKVHLNAPTFHNVTRPAGVATLFLAGIVARLSGPVLWCLTRRDLFAPGLARAGLHPDWVIYAETLRDREILPVRRRGCASRGSRPWWAR